MQGSSEMVGAAAKGHRLRWNEGAADRFKAFLIPGKPH